MLMSLMIVLRLLLAFCGPYDVVSVVALAVAVAGLCVVFVCVCSVCVRVCVLCGFVWRLVLLCVVHVLAAAVQWSCITQT